MEVIEDCNIFHLNKQIEKYLQLIHKPFHFNSKLGDSVKPLIEELFCFLSLYWHVLSRNKSFAEQLQHYEETQMHSFNVYQRSQ